MLKIFIMEINGKKCCVNATTDFAAEQFRLQGGVEVDKKTVEEVFGDLAQHVCPSNTFVDEDGKITFDAPQFEEPGEEEIKELKFTSLRQKRDQLLASTYDKAKMSLDRKYELATDEAVKEALKEQIYQWNVYAEALCDLPSQPGAPWDGGGPETPWPEPPAMPVKNI